MGEAIKRLMVLCHLGITIPARVVSRMAEQLKPENPVHHGIRLLEVHKAQRLLT